MRNLKLKYAKLCCKFYANWAPPLWRILLASFSLFNMQCIVHHIIYWYKDSGFLHHPDKTSGGHSAEAEGLSQLQCCSAAGAAVWACRAAVIGWALQWAVGCLQLPGEWQPTIVKYSPLFIFFCLASCWHCTCVATCLCWHVSVLTEQCVDRRYAEPRAAQRSLYWSSPLTACTRRLSINIHHTIHAGRGGKKLKFNKPIADVPQLLPKVSPLTLCWCWRCEG